MLAATREPVDEALAEALLRQQSDAQRARRAGTPEPEPLAADAHLAVGALAAGERSEHRRAPAADEPREPDDLAARGAEAHVACTPGDREAAHLEIRAVGPLDRRLRRGPCGDGARAGDHLDEVGARQVARVGIADGLAVAHRVDAVAQPQHLVEAVRHEDHRAAAIADAAHRAEDPLDAVRVHRRGRLVEHEQAPLVHERAGDRRRPALPDRRLVDGPRDVDLDAELREHRPRATVDAAPVDRAGPAGTAAAQEEVLGHRLRTDEVQLLVDHRDAVLQRDVRRAQHDLLAVERDRARVGLDHAAEHPDERALAGAVGADETEDLAGADGEVRRADGLDAAEALAHALHLEACGVTHPPRPIASRSPPGSPRR